MPAVISRGLRADFAAKLSQLETGTAVLERDARKERAGLIERGFDFPLTSTHLADLRAAPSRLLAPFVRLAGPFATALRWLKRTAPYVAGAFRIGRRCVIDGAICLVIAAVALAPFTLAILLLAPPE